MPPLDWKEAEAKLNRIVDTYSPIDACVVINVVAPLRLRLHNGERTVKLYKQIKRLQSLERAAAKQRTGSRGTHKTSAPVQR
jgi:hypothetical protein